MSGLNPVRFSELKHIARSPAHYQYALRHGRRDSISMRIGRIVDAALLGGREPLVWDGTRRTKAYDAFEEQNPGADIVTMAEVEMARPVIDALVARQDVMDLLNSGVKQKRLHWEWLGRPCTGQPDVHGRLLVDLKTARCSEPGRFTRQGTWLAYHAQLAWYRMGMVASGLQPPGQVLLVAVETEPPYPVTVLSVTERALDQGERLCRSWMERLIACEAVNHWPGYVESVVDFDVPDELDLDFGGDDEEAA